MKIIQIPFLCATALVAPALPAGESATTALLQAVEARDLSAVEISLAAGANPNARVGNKSVLARLLGDDCHSAKPGMVYALLQAGAVPEGLEEASYWERSVYAPYFSLKRGEKVTAAQAATMMEQAVDIGAPVWAKMALECGADPNGYCTGESDPQREGYTYLYRAVFGGECHYGDSLGTARVLLLGGADPNKPNVDGRVPLQCWRCWKEHMDILLGFGADPMVISSEGKTTLMYAGTGEAVQALLAAGVPWGARDKAGKSALWYALHSEYWGAARALLESAPEDEAEYARELLRLHRRTNAHFPVRLFEDVPGY